MLTTSLGECFIEFVGSSVWRFECSRCGLVVETRAHENADRCYAAARGHVCDPSVKTGYKFDPNEPYDWADKADALLKKTNALLKSGE